MRITEDLRQVGATDYERTVHEFVRAFGREGLSLYFYGGPIRPPISDLDLAIAFPQDVSGDGIGSLARRTKEFISENSIRDAVFMHDILIYPCDLFQEIKYLHTMRNLRHLSGPKVSIREPSAPEAPSLEAIRFLNFTDNLVNELEWIRRMRRVGLRYLMLVLGSARHSVAFLLDRSGDERLEILGKVLDEIRDQTAASRHLSAGKANEATHFLRVLEAAIREHCADFAKGFLGNRLSLDSKIPERVLVLKGKRLIKVSTYMMLHGASYGKVYKEKGSIYKKIHARMYPLRSFEIHEQHYKRIIGLQMRVVHRSEKLFSSYGIRPMVPLMSGYAVPVLTWKGLVESMVNRIMLRVQGV